MAKTGRHPDLSNYPAEKARQGKIVLRRPWQRIVFIAGLAGGVILPLLIIMFLGRAH